MENKSNRELAVDVAIACIEASAKQVNNTGGSIGLPKLEGICNVIKGVYNTLENLSLDK